MVKLALPLSCLSLCLWLVACSKPAATPLPQLSAVPNLQTRLTPDAAYAAIPHRRTEINLSNSTLSTEHRRYVELALSSLDQAVALRVTTLQNMMSGDRKLDGYTAQQDRLIAFLQGITPPSDFAQYHEQILAALRHQRAFFLAWSGSRSDIRNHPEVQASSGALRSAYDLLKSRVSGQAPGNDNAIFDYHCALDFI